MVVCLFNYTMTDKNIEELKNDIKRLREELLLKEQVLREKLLEKVV